MNAFKAMFTPYRMALASARNPYQIGLLFTHNNGDFGAISVTEPRGASPYNGLYGEALLERNTFFRLGYIYLDF